MKLILILSLGIFISILFTWPYVLYLNSYYPNYDDFAFNGWTLWYNQTQIISGNFLNPASYFNANQFYPNSFSLVFSEIMFFPSIIFTPIYILTKSQVFSVNSYVFLTFVLSFIGSFYVIKYFIKNTSASIIGALIYTFNPLTFSHFPGHLHLMNKYFLPLVFLYAYKFITKPCLTNSFFFFLFFTLNALCAVHFQMFSIILLPFFFLPFLIVKIRKKNLIYFKKLGKSVLVILIFLPILLYFNLPYLEFSFREKASRSISEQIGYSAEIPDWVASLPNNLVYQNFVIQLNNIRRNNPNINYAEHTLSLNILPFVLFIFASATIYQLFKKRQVSKENKILIFSFGLVLTISTLLTFGPVWGNSINPFYQIFQGSPLLSGIRVPSRFQFIFYVPFSIAVAFGAKQILEKNIKKSLLITLILISIIFLENCNLFDFTQKSLLFDPAEKGLIQQFQFLKNSVTIHFPTFISTPEKQILYLSWSTITKETIVNGYSGYFPLYWYRFLESLNSLPGASDSLVTDISNLKQEKNLELLKQLHLLGARNIIIHKNLLNNQMKKHIESNFSLYHKGIIFEDKNILILNLTKYSFNAKRCSLSDTNQYEIKPTLFINSKITWARLTIYNPNDCYIVNLYNNRYAKLNFINNSYHYYSYLTLPLIIEPLGSFSLITQVFVKNRDLFRLTNQQKEMPFEEIRIIQNYKFPQMDSLDFF